MERMGKERQVGYGLEWNGSDGKGKAGRVRTGMEGIGKERQVGYGVEWNGSER